MSDVIIPLNMVQQILDDAQRVIDAALSVADEVPTIVRSQAIEHNEDCFGAQMNTKQPRPRRNPTNHPDTPLIQNDTPDLMNDARWRTQRISNTETHVIFSPPEHQTHLEQKDPNHGGRKWITAENLNPNAARIIAEHMAQKANKELNK